MSHPLVDADDTLVADLLAGTLEILREAGGFIAPTTRLVERHGQLSIESSADDGSPMLRIPRECFVRVDRVTWAEQEGRMVIVEVPDDFGDLETEMLYLQVALHNACGKLEWMTATHPALDPRLPDDLVEAVQQLIPSFRNPMMAATDVLWANRCFRIPMSEGAAPERVLVPVVDLLNHHSRGAVGDWTGDDFEVATSRPFGTHECALDYGMDRDALEMAVVYGFADHSGNARNDRDDDTDILDRMHALSSRPGAPDSASPLREAVEALRR
ncbi:MAG: hypothetical protein ACKOAF_06050 [Actinomycetes bacterium]